MRPDFLAFDEIIAIHRDQIKRYGGEPGIRDVTLLRSAVAMPQSGFRGQFSHQDIFEMAAAYLFHIVQNHPFLDGNKRTGTAAAIVFLAMNNIDIDVENLVLEKFVLSVASGKTDKPAIAKFFRSHAQ